MTSVGYKMLKLYADALLITHHHFDHDNAAAVFSSEPLAAQDC